MRKSVRDLTRAVLAPPIVPERTSVALLLLRVFVGVAFWFHGSGKTADLSAFATEFQIPLVLAAAAAYTQVAGGLLMVLGLCTPASALGLSATMAVAMTELIARGERFINPGGHSWEACAFYFIATVTLLVAGPGRWSLDALLFTRARSFANSCHTPSVQQLICAPNLRSRPPKSVVGVNHARP